MTMNLLAVVTPPSIYRGCSTRKMLWEVNFILGEFTPVNMKNCGHHNARNHTDLNSGEKYITLDIFLKFGSLDKMKIKSSEQNFYWGTLGKVLITSLSLKTIGRSKKKKSQGMPLLMLV